MNYEPYNFDSFKELVAHAYRLGWYGGTRTLFNLKCEGAFEGWSGRATEDWEQRFTLTSEEIPIDGQTVDSTKRKIPALNITGKSIKEVCDKAMKILATPNV